MKISFLKQLVATSIFLFVFINLWGQDFKKITYLIELGTNFNLPFKGIVEGVPDQNGNPINKFETKIGYFFGFNLSYNFNNRFSLGTGLTYSESKLGYVNIIEKEKSVGTLTKSYIRLPIIAKYKIFHNLPLYLGIGTYYGELISAQTSVIVYTSVLIWDTPDPVFPNNQHVTQQTIYDKDYYYKYDFGLVGQVNYDYKINDKLTGVFFAKTDYGLTNIDKKYVDAWKNHDLVIGVGIKF